MQREEFLSHCILGDCRCCYYLERLTHIVSTVGEKCVYVRKVPLSLWRGGDSEGQVFEQNIPGVPMAS